MSGRRALACVAVPLVLAVALVILWRVRPAQVSASLHDLIGAQAERIPKFLREASASEVAVIVSSPDAGRAESTAREFGTRPGDLPPGALDFVRKNRSGLVTRETAESLATEAGRARLAKRAVRRLFVSPVSPILGYEDDPFGLTDAFLLSLSGGGRKTADGFPVMTTNGMTRVLVRLRIDRQVAENLDRTIDFCAELERKAKRVASEGVEVRLAGVPVHTAASAARSRTEIGVLTWFSVLFIAGLSLVVFRSWRWIPLLASSLMVSALAGVVALMAAFRELHLMTFVMGTTVLGLVIDYSFHWLLSSEADKPSVRRNLFVSFLTTELSLVPLMLATIPVLRQSALFLGVGLAAAFGYVLTCYPTGGWRTQPSVRQPSVGLLRGIVICVVLASVLGLREAEVKTEAPSLYRPSAELREAEHQRASFGVLDLSKIPTSAERRKVAADVRRLYAEHGAEMARTLQVPVLVSPPEPLDDLVSPQTLMASVFAAWTREALVRLAFSALALLVALAFLCRRRAVRVFLPSLLALVVVGGTLGWAGAPINVFHILASFLLLGMGVDYAVFLQSGGAAALRPALSSLLTSMAGFGALAFVSFPVVSSFGIVLGIGLPVAFLAALACRRTESAPSAEHGASPVGLEVLWLLYRVFGLRILRFAAACVGGCVWTFSGAVRRASPSFRRTLGFTRSLADKLVVMAGGRDVPRVATDGSDDAAGFLSDVRGGKGVFILSSHCGAIEVLVALGDCAATFHAWTDVGRTSVFNRFYLRHVRRPRVVIHPISEIGMETAFFAGEALDRGDCLVMAGDRGRGAFRFAHALGHPAYFVACVWTGDAYRAIVRRLPSETAEMERRYGEVLRETIAAFPYQSYTWEK